MTVKPVIDVTVPAITFLLRVAVGSDLRLADFRKLRAQFGLILAGLLLPLVLLPAFRAGPRTAQVAA